MTIAQIGPFPLDVNCIKGGIESSVFGLAGALAESDYYAAVLAYLKESPRKDRISLHTDLSQEALQGLFQQSCVFALHSKEESQGIAPVEAMAAGLPVVAT